jgi:hypothetical protein
MFIIKNTLFVEGDIHLQNHNAYVLERIKNTK